MKSFKISILTPDEISDKTKNDNYQPLGTKEGKTADIYKNPANGEILIPVESDLSFESLVNILKSAGN